MYSFSFQGPWAWASWKHPLWIQRAPDSLQQTQKHLLTEKCQPYLCGKNLSIAACKLNGFISKRIKKNCQKKKKSFALYSLYSLVINWTVLKLFINATDDESWFPDKLHWKIPFALLPVYKNAFGCNAGPLFMQYSLSLGISIHTIENEILK